MAASEAMVELAALEQARSRLEAALESDENWRALQQSGADGEGAEDSAARRARDTRLEMALADNPVYHAWQHLNEAIDALRASNAEAGEPEPAVVRAEFADEGGLDSSDLPQDIADLIRANNPAHMPEDREDSVEDREASAEDPRDSADSPASEGVVADNPEPPETGEPAAPPADAEPVDETEAPPGSQSARLAETDLAETDSEPADGAMPIVQKAADPRPQPAGRDVPGRNEEATVTFVRRAPRAPLLPSAQLPADLGTERKSELFERLRGLSDDPGLPQAPISPAEGSAEEAEVVIVSTEIARERQEAEARAGRVRRFRKALSGD